MASTQTVAQAVIVKVEDKAPRRAGGYYAGRTDLIEDTGQSFLKGGPVAVAAATGKIAEAEVSGNQVAAIAGFAVAAASGTANTAVALDELRPGDVVKCNLTDAGSTVAGSAAYRKHIVNFDVSSHLLVANRAGGSPSTSKLYGVIDCFYADTPEGAAAGHAVDDTNPVIFVRIPDQPYLQLSPM